MKAPLSASVLAVLAITAGLSGVAHADNAKRPAADPAGAAAPIAPSCSIRSPSSTWKVPVNAPRVPVFVAENSGGKLTPSVTLSPNAEYTLLADSGTPRPDYYRTLTLTGDNLSVGDVFNVTLGGTCANAPSWMQMETFSMTIELVASAPAPTVLGTMAENPQGTTLLTLDPSFHPYRQVATITFTRNGASLGEYAPGQTASAGDRYGVIACVGGACDPRPGAPLAGAQPLRLGANDVCKEGRDSGVVEVPLSAQAHIPGATAQPAAVTGSIHVDCGKATDQELGKGTGTAPNTVANGNAVGTGCSVGATGATTSGALSALFGLALVGFGRRRREPRP
ncbi:MAG: MYXO-CTERM sorting domain-containing protein [Polyangiaceae bacterium]